MDSSLSSCDGGNRGTSQFDARAANCTEASPDRADALRITEDLLTTFPTLNGIFSVADGMAMGAVDAINAHKPRRQITVTTASFSRETVPYLKAGLIGINVDEDPVLMGRTAVNTAVRGLNGEKVPKTIYIPNRGITKSGDPKLVVFLPSGDLQPGPKGGDPQIYGEIGNEALLIKYVDSTSAVK